MAKQRRVMGKLSGPIIVDRAFTKPMNFDHADVDAQSLVLVRGNQRCHVNTYDGYLGRKISDDAIRWHDLDDKKRKEIENSDGDWTEIPMDSYPEFLQHSGAESAPAESESEYIDEDEDELEDEEELEEVPE